MQSQEVNKEEDDDGPPPGWQPIPTPPAPQPPPPRRPSDLAQMVCGSCRRLLSYPRGAKHVKCSCCQTVNIVLEADQVGQVKCGSCAIMLMHPYGASQVRCSSCRFVTEIGNINLTPKIKTPKHMLLINGLKKSRLHTHTEHNKRPPWSVQQRKPAPPKTGC